MNKAEALDRLVTALENVSGRFIIKDFVGFMNWEPSLAAVLLPYIGHRSAFCQSIKSNAQTYSRCITCSIIHQRRCMRRQLPFSGTCYMGIDEYAIPIMIDDLCIGSISIGNYCLNEEDANRRMRKEAARSGEDYEVLKQLFGISVGTKAPSEEVCAVFQFVASYLAEELRPYAHRAQQKEGTVKTPDAGFDTIQTYIFNNYTNPTIGIASIAESCNYSQSYVSHTFSRKMKVNVRTYINQLRIILAKHELAAGSSVSYTAMICGFNDANYFSNVFRAMVGIPPSQYAKHRQKEIEKQ